MKNSVSLPCARVTFPNKVRLDDQYIFDWFASVQTFLFKINKCQRQSGSIKIGEVRFNPKMLVICQNDYIVWTVKR